MVGEIGVVLSLSLQAEEATEERDWIALSLLTVQTLQRVWQFLDGED